jgi:hypothetical protein
MKTLATLLLVILAIVSPTLAAGELTLYNGAGQATAYVAEDATIYLWGGTPAAYLDPGTDRDATSIYGFNGKHLGWFTKGVIYGPDGKAVGAVRGAFASITDIEPIKSIKQIKPIQAIKQIAPIKPIFTMQWSQTPLKLLLLSGASN